MTSSWLPLEPGSVAIVLALGLCLGSFLNVVIARLPRGMSLLRPGLRCPECGHPIRPWHNVPLLGWLILRGRCADCRKRIPLRYPLVELGGGALVFAAVYLCSSPLRSLAALWLLLALLAVLLIDWEHRIIPDEISLGGTALGLLLSPWTIGWKSALAGAAAGALGLFLVAWLYQRLRGRAGMGMGDVKLAAMLGAFLGLSGIALTVLLASLVGSVLGLGIMAARKGTGTTALPFGSFLAPAAAITLLWGPRIWHWYAGFFPKR